MDDDMNSTDQPIARYGGEYITCYPGSNQSDEGKLQLEFNMARFVTRLSSKNFCIIKPCFGLTSVVDQNTYLPMIRVDPGECSINGMDLIMTSELFIEPPSAPGTWHLAFHLARDSSSNVLGDFVYGAQTTFEGVYLTYYDNKPDPVPADMFYLGSVDWDGTSFSNIIEDEDKYGRIWAEDVLGKFMDPKHPDVRRLNLQEYIYKIPDWYFSKEGDVVYGPITVVDDREHNNEGILINVDDYGSHITIKHPTTDDDRLQLYGDFNRDGIIDQRDLDYMRRIINEEVTPSYWELRIGDVNHDGVIDEDDYRYMQNFINGTGNPGDTGNVYYIDDTDTQLNVDVSGDQFTIEIAKAEIKENSNDDILHIDNRGKIRIDAEDDLILEGEEHIYISTEHPRSPLVDINNTSVNITDPDAPNTQFDFELTRNQINGTFYDLAQFVLGKSVWQYDYFTKRLTLYRNDVNNEDQTWFLDIYPDTDFKHDIRVQNDIYIGTKDIFGEEQTFLSSERWRLTKEVATASNIKNYPRIDFTPNNIILSNPTGNGTSYLMLQKLTGNTAYQSTLIKDNGTITLTNKESTNTSITFEDGTSANNVIVEKIRGQKKLNIQGNLNVTQNAVIEGSLEACGITSTNGKITWRNGTNDAYIVKKANDSALRTSHNFYVGESGTKELYAGATLLHGVFNQSNRITFAIGSDQNNMDPTRCEFQVDAAGNLETSGTIRGARVYNAVYNDIVEFMEKENYAEIIEPGDIVYFNISGKVSKYHEGISQYAIAGIVSSEETYGYALGGAGLEDDQKVPVALKGRVYVKTDNTGFVPGDFVAVDACGCVYKGDHHIYDNYVLGIATQPEKDGKVLVLVR